MKIRHLAFLVACTIYSSLFPPAASAADNPPTAAPPAPRPWGEFIGHVVNHWPRPGEPDFSPDWPAYQLVLDADFSYRDPRGAEWKAPKGDHADGASIPEFLWGKLVGTPLTGPYREAAVLHDVYCYRKEKALPQPGGDRDWAAIHQMFYEAM